MLARLLPRRGAERSYDGSGNPIFYSLPGGYGMTSAAYTGESGVEDALRNAASWACIRVLADALGRSPIKAVREVRGEREDVNPQPRLLVRPSAIVPVDVWKSQLAFSTLTDGNVFASVASTDNAGRPDQLEIMDPAHVIDRKMEKGIPTVKLKDQSIHQLYPFGDIWHMAGDLVLPGTPFGVSPLTYARKVIGTSLAAEDFSFGFFNDGGHPPVALISDTEMGSTDAEDYKRRYMQATRGKREPVVMGDGIKIQELHLDPSETQFIDLMRFCVEQACRFWGVPPSMVFSAISGQHMTYANVTQADLHFLKHALEGKYVRIETAFTDLLPGNSYTSPSIPNTLAVVDREAVLKADIATRYESYKVGLENRFLTINEVRAEENEAPFPGAEFDKPGVPPFAPTQDPNAFGGGAPAPTGTPVPPAQK